MSAVPVPSRRYLLGRLRFLRTTQGAVGLAMLLVVAAVALIGPLIAPHPLDQPIGPPGVGPAAGAPLGTDYLGRDVLSRTLHGGFPVLWLSVLSTAATYLVGTVVGMAAGLSRSWVDGVLMRSVDLFLVFPPLLLLLVLVAVAGGGSGILLIGIVLVLAPGVARLVRTATLEISTTGYIEAAVARGETTGALMRREILPNITPVLVADAGVRYLGAVFLVASLNFLGVGAQPPAANWALMIAENRQIISNNVWSVAAPAILLGVLTISVNLLGDAYVHTRHRSED
jgi:ABC-type dipeptide/oligopeptide/nickel transport system permease subunit